LPSYAEKDGGWAAIYEFFFTAVKCRFGKICDRKEEKLLGIEGTS
jgi:hypothetical protein